MSEQEITDKLDPEYGPTSTAPCGQREFTDYTLGDYDRWYKKCGNCGYDPGRSDSNRCWQCGRLVHRDFSDRALRPDKKKV